MSFTTIPPKSARLPKFRESEAAYQALKKQATKAGITPAEAIRQLVSAFLAKPFKLTNEALPDGTKGHQWAPVNVDPVMLESITKAAQKAGVTVTEAIRQIVRRHLLTHSKGDV